MLPSDGLGEINTAFSGGVGDTAGSNTGGQITGKKVQTVKGRIQMIDYLTGIKTPNNNEENQFFMD